MNDHIRLGFRNDKTLLNERILSEDEFPVAVSSEENAHISVVVTCGDNKRIFDGYLSALADFIMNRYEKKLLSRMIRKNYDEVKPYQVQEILGHLNDIEQDRFVGRNARKNAVLDSLRQYFDENNSASVEGLVTFRLQAYQTLLGHAAEQLLELFLIEREYEEFVSLLRYFVNVQNKILKIHRYM